MGIPRKLMHQMMRHIERVEYNNDEVPSEFGNQIWE